MLKARTLTVLINRPIDEVYGFLSQPDNMARWMPIGSGQAEPAEGPLVWSFVGPDGEIMARFSPPNDLYVLDYTLQSGAHIWQSSSVRLIRNGNGCVLVHTSVQQPLVSDAAFMETDLHVLKTLLER